jgi:hypothetical protein
VTVCLAAALPVSYAVGQEKPLQDPMRPAVRAPGGAAGTAATRLRLEGIVIAASRRLALIDGEFLEEGQRIHGVSIERIDRESVTVRRNGQTVVLRPESVAAMPAADSGEP